MEIGEGGEQTRIDLGNKMEFQLWRKIRIPLYSNVRFHLNLFSDNVLSPSPSSKHEVYFISILDSGSKIQLGTQTFFLPKD